MDFAKNALFKSYGVIYIMYLTIGAAIYEVLFVFYSYPSDDTETVTSHPYIITVGHYGSPSSAMVGRS